jgi:hypothetical protein
MDTPLEKVEAGYYHYKGLSIVNHPRVLPRSWNVIRDGSQIGFDDNDGDRHYGFKTLRAALHAIDDWKETR